MFHAPRKYASHIFIIGSQVNKRGGGVGIIYLFLPVVSTCSSRIISSIDFFKLCKILADHDQCIQWCKEHNLLPSSIMCPRENCSHTLSLTRRASSRDGYEWRCSRRKCNGIASMRQNSWFLASNDLFESYLQEWL